MGGASVSPAGVSRMASVGGTAAGRPSLLASITGSAVSFVRTSIHPNKPMEEKPKKVHSGNYSKKEAAQ